MPVDVAHEYWAIICDFLRFDERYKLLALCKESVHSPARHRYFSQSRWRVPHAEHIAARVASTMTMQRFITRAVINESWQQAYLSEFSMLESLQFRSEAFGDGTPFDISSELPVSLRQLSLLPTYRFKRVNASSLARLVNLEDLGIWASGVDDGFVLSGLSKLTRLELGGLVWGLMGYTHVPLHLRKLKLEAMDSWDPSWNLMATLESLELRRWQINSLDDFNELMEIAPQLKTFRATLLGDSQRIGMNGADRLVRSMTKVEELELDLEPDDDEFYMDGNPSLHSFDATAGLTSLRVLKHTSSVVDDLSPLASLINLEVLSVYAPRADWSPIVNCKKLRYVCQQINYDEQNATSGPALKQLPLLKTLEEPFQMSSEHSLVELTTLVARSLANSASFRLDWCPNLVDLTINGGSPLFDAMNFAYHVPKLKALKYCGTRKLDLSPLVHLKELKHLAVDSVASVGYQSLHEMIGITELYLENTDVVDATMLCNMKKLRSLSLKNTKVEDISVLAELKELRTLDLRGSRVCDVSCLFGHPELRSLTLPSQAGCRPLIRNYGVALPRLIHIDHVACRQNHWTGNL